MLGKIKAMVKVPPCVHFLFININLTTQHRCNAVSPQIKKEFSKSSQNDSRSSSSSLNSYCRTLTWNWHGKLKMESLIDACLQDSQLVTYTGVTFGLRIVHRSFAYFHVSLLESLKRRRTGGEVDFCVWLLWRCVQHGTVSVLDKIKRSVNFWYYLKLYKKLFFANQFAFWKQLWRPT